MASKIYRVRIYYVLSSGEERNRAVLSDAQFYFDPDSACESRNALLQAKHLACLIMEGNTDDDGAAYAASVGFITGVVVVQHSW